MSATATSTRDAVAQSALDPQLLELRGRLLRERLPALERGVADLTEAEEVRFAWADLAGDEGGLLDPRGDAGPIAVARLTVAIEALATRRQSFLMPVLLSALSCAPLLLAGSAEQARRAAAVASGAERGAFALSEAGAGSDVAATSTVAEPVRGGYLLSGAKRWISVVEPLDWLVVFARESVEQESPKLSCFLVDRHHPGVELVPREPGLGMRGVPLCDVLLDEVELPAEALVGEPGRGFGLAMRSLGAVRPLVAARGLGLTASLLMAATVHAEQRAAFGGTLFDRQAVRVALAGLAARLEAARALTYAAALHADRGELGPDASPALASCKLLATELAVEAASTCMRLAGAHGYQTEHPFGRAVRDAQQLTVVEGSSEVQLELIARGLGERSLWWSGDGGAA